jgi:hypothetical protein
MVDKTSPATVLIDHEEPFSVYSTLYVCIGDPPSEAGADHVIDIDTPLPASLTKLIIDGAPGTVNGLTGLENSEGLLVPIAFIAETLNT